MRRRLCAAYHIKRSLATRLGLPEYPCACTRCRGARIKKVHTVARHGKLKYVSLAQRAESGERRLESGNFQICWVIIGEVVPIPVDFWDSLS